MVRKQIGRKKISILPCFKITKIQIKTNIEKYAEKCIEENDGTKWTYGDVMVPLEDYHEENVEEKSQDKIYGYAAGDDATYNTPNK